MTGKHILRKSMSKSLPEKIVSRAKKGFPLPLNRWVTEDLSEIMINKLYDSTIISETCVPEAIRKILRNANSWEPVKRFRSTNQMWLLFMFALWHDIFISENQSVNL
jgi:asparagine synthase (glutamine-hydrolysing)